MCRRNRARMPKSSAKTPTDQAALLERLDELAARVQQLERDLQHAERLATVGTLAGAIAHEFNNILTPVMSYAQLALNSPNNPELVAKALHKAVDGTEKAAHIASSVLGFIRDDDTAPITHVGAAVQDSLTCLAREPEKDGIDLTVDIPQDCWVRIRPVALQQVLMNLVLNARDAMQPRGGHIQIRAECSTWNRSGGGGTGAVTIYIADTGHGIAPDLLPRLFQPFVRGPKAPGASRGTGLGLVICKRLINEAGGSISVESEPGKGTTFIITLPRTTPTAEQKAA